jgi:dipeptidyl aminopeptidase/acylaminoacyl peptidase
MPAPSDWVAIGAAASPAFSRDGKTLFHLRGAGLPQVWQMSLETGEASQISAHDEKVATLRRAPKDDRLLWSIDAGGDERHQLWLREPGGEPRSLTALPDVIHDFGAFSPDGTRIAFASNDRAPTGLDIIVMDIATGERRRLLRGEGQRSVTNWSPAGDRLIVLEDRSSGDQSLFLVDVATGASAELPRTGQTRYAAARFAADGTSILALTDHGDSDFMRLCRFEIESGTFTPVFAAPGRDVEAWSLSPDGALLATIENDRGYAILRVGAAGMEREPVANLPVGIVGDLGWAPDSTALAFVAQGPTTPPGLWLWKAAANAARLLWQPDIQADSGIDPASLRPLELISWTSEDGTIVPGWFARPATPPPSGGYPSIVWVHGGPASQTRANWRPDIQMLLAQGFAVMMPNVRGSTGYGRTWMESDDIERRPVAVADLVAGRAWLAAQSGIAPERIGIMGQSYGGWMVLAAITQHPNLWRAAIDYYGIADWFTLLRDTGPWRRSHRAQEYGVPGRDDEVLEALSPIRLVGAVTAPLLVAHGDRDPRVPMNESDQFVDAMEKHQKRVRYERFTYAGHGFIRPDHRNRVYDSVARHFQETL